MMSAPSLRLLFTVNILVFCGATIASAQGSLSDEQVASAIALGQQGKDLSVRVGTISGRGALCAAIMDGPVSRIATAAAAAMRGYRPFTIANVTETMRARTYTVSLRSDRSGLSCLGH